MMYEIANGTIEIDSEDFDKTRMTNQTKICSSVEPLNCSFCSLTFIDRAALNWHLIEVHSMELNEQAMLQQEDANKMPPEEGKRDKICPRHDLIPLEFLDELASIFEEGQRPRPGMPEGYGDSWKSGGVGFLRDCLNHVSNHLHKYMNGDRTENHLSKVAWGALVVRYFNIKNQEEK